MSVTAAELTEKAIYGLPELNGDRIASAAVVANPGCYATSVILPCALCCGPASSIGSGESFPTQSPVFRERARSATARTHFVSVADNLSAYSVFGHRHIGRNSGTVDP